MTSALAPVATASTFQLLDIAWLKPSPANPRRHMSDEADQQLADSISQVGILEPLIVRPIGRSGGFDHYEVVAGHRRLRGAQLADLERVPCIVRELTDTEALEIAVIENDQRRDVHPLDEAEAFMRLMEAGPYTPAALAAKLGRPLRFVVDRVNLLALIPEARGAFEDEKLTLGHAALLVKLTKEQQAEALRHCYDVQFDFAGGEDDVEVLAPVHKLQAWINRNVRLDLSTSQAQAEFPELAAEVATAAAKGATVLMLSDEYHADGDALTRSQWHECDEDEAGAQRGVIVQGRRRGKALWVRLPTPVKPARGGKAPKLTKAQKAQELERKKAEAARERELAVSKDIVRRGALALANGGGKKHLDAAMLRVITAGLVQVECFGYGTNIVDNVADEMRIDVAALAMDEEGTAARTTLGPEQLIRLVAVLAVGASNQGWYDISGYRAALEAFGIDVDAIEADVRAELAS